MNLFFIDSQVTTPLDLPWGQYYDSIIAAKTPLMTSALYLFVVTVCSRIVRGNSKLGGGKVLNKKETSGLGLKLFVIFHNLLLMVFSLLTFYHTAIILFNQFTSSQPFGDKFCDKNQQAWRQGIFFWGWLFYLSKYYEMIDTAIILIKGKVPSFLQSYHHAGAIIGMWTLTANNTPGAWIFITLNSFIHTIMYSYYILTTLGYKPTGKKYITYMQIAQFVVGISIALVYILLPNCQTPAQNLSIMFNLGYVTPLIFLFYQFAQNSYTVKNVKKA